MERRLQSLAGEWEVMRIDKRSGKPAGNPFPGKVPGDVISDLLRNGMIEDPYIDANSKKCLWANDYDWLYRTRLDGPCQQYERKFLRFTGVDYEAWFRLNGNLLGSHEGMFGRVTFELTSSLEKDNELDVLIVGQRNLFREKLPFINPIVLSEKSRMSTMKAQYSYGWDFAPPLKGGGIWDDVHIHSTGPAAIEDIWIMPDMWTDTVQAKVFLSSRATGEGEIHWAIEPVNHDGPGCEGVEPVKFATGPQRVTIKSIVPDAHAWEPWDMGEQNLYRMSVEIHHGDDPEPSDAISDTFGFRNIGFETNPKAPKDSAPWTLVVNGRRLYMRGVNWVPMDSLLARLDEKRYRKLLSMAREMGANMIRVWGGGLREKKVFYDICDELGLLVWQEFPFACAFMRRYPRSTGFLKLVARECGDIVRQLRNHPSLFIWCGGNELHYRRNLPLLETIQRQVEVNDGTRRFHPTSPAQGDAHNWVVWHGKGNLDDYLDDKAPIISEFGLQAVPDKATLEKMFSDPERWPPEKKLWRHHNIEWGKILKYTRYVPQENSLEGFIDASQSIQAHILKTAIERWRRMKFVKSGFGIWQFNEPWPAVCWSVVDYFGRPKQAYHALKMSMAPLAVTLFFPLGDWERGDKFPYDIVVINDYHRTFNGLIAKVYIGSEEVDSVRFHVKPNSVVAAEKRKVRLDFDPPFKLSVVLADSHGAEMARNEYDLDVFDPERASPIVALFSNLLWKWVTREPPPPLPDEEE